MKVRLLSLVSVVLVLSIKAYETKARESNDARRMAIFEPESDLVDGNQFMFISPLDSLVAILSESKAVKEQHVGFAGITPKEYRAFETLKETAEQEELNNLLTHHSPIVRVYAYRALYANEMEINVDYETALMNDTTAVDWFSGCVLMPSSVQDLVSEGFID